MSAPFDEAACLRADPIGSDKGDDPFRVLSDRIVTARKVHECHDCLGPIMPGTRSRVRCDVSVGEFMTFRWCSECCAAHVAYDRGDINPLMARDALAAQRRRERAA